MPYRFAALIVLGLLIASPSFAASNMTGKELTALLADGQEIVLGGPGARYAGKLSLTADGKGLGQAKTDSGDVIKISRIWKIKKDKFCRTWKDLDGGKEVCERWAKTGPNSANVMLGKKKIGANSW